MAGANINRVILTGNLCRDPELRTTGSGTSVCSLRLAVNGRRKNHATDQWEDVPNYFDVTVWGAQGENCARYLAKGRGVAIDGRLQWREFTDKNDNRRQAVDVVAESVQFLGGRDDGGGNGQRSSGGGGRGHAEEPPFDTGDFTQASMPGADSDIPFLRDLDLFEFDVWHGHQQR